MNPRFRLFLFLPLLLIVIFGLSIRTTYSVDTDRLNQLKLSDTSTERVIVRFRSITPSFIRALVIRNAGAEELEPLLTARTFVLKVPRGLESRISEHFARSPWVELAEPDFVAQKSDTPTDTYFDKQWGQDSIHTLAAWSQTTGEGIDIAILDTGIADHHADLTGKVKAWQNFTYSSSPYDKDGHGSHVAGIAAAVTNNSLGVAGTGYNANLMSVKVLDDYGRGYYSWIINGIYWAVDHGAEVVNLSLGGTAPSVSLQNAVDYAWDHGVIVVSAAGNGGGTTAHYPAYYAHAIGVASIDESGQKSSFSNYGTWVSFAAPGEMILSTIPSNDYGYYSGTSMATPHVAGVVALVMAEFPGYSPAQIVSRMESTASHIAGTGLYWSAGLINAQAAVGASSLPVPTPTPTPTPEPTPTPSPTPTPEPTPTPTPSPTSTPISTPTPTSSTSPEPSASPTPDPSLPWWCKYVPHHRFCQI